MTANTAHAPVTPIRPTDAMPEAENPKPKSLQEQINELKGLISFYDTAVLRHLDAEDALKRSLPADEYRIKVLERKANGTTRANAQVESLKKRLDHLVSKIGEENELDSLIKDRTERELAKIHDKLTPLISDVETDVEFLMDMFTEHSGQLAEHEERITIVKLQSDATDERVENVDGRVRTIEDTQKIPVILYVAFAALAIAAWIVTAILWHSHSWAPAPLEYADGKTIEQTTPLDSVGIAIAIGAIPALIVFAAFLFFSPNLAKALKRRKKQKASEATTSPASSKEETTDTATPTQVMKTTPGA